MTDIEFDDEGWSAIHHCVAAEKELLMSIEKFVTSNEEFLECETKDRFHRTPLLLAVAKDKTKSVEKLLELGARITALDAYNHGVVEICAMTDNLEMLSHFIEMNNPELAVWKRLIKFLSADTDEESEKAAIILDKITKEQDGEVVNEKTYWEPFVQASGVSAVIKVCKSAAGDTVKVRNLHILNNIIHHPVVPGILAKAGGIKILISLVTKNLKGASVPVLNIIKEVLFSNPEMAGQVCDAGFLPIAVKLMSSPEKLAVESVANVVESVGAIASSSPAMQKTVGMTSLIFKSLLGLFQVQELQTSVRLLSALTNTTRKLVSGNKENQTECIDCEGAAPLIMVSRANKYRDLQTSAIRALYELSLDNIYASNNILEEGAVLPLMQILKKSRALSLQEAISLTLWSLAGPDINNKRSMASMMGVNLLIEFLGAAGPSAENLNYIGAEGLGVLAQGAHNKQMAIAEANGIQPLVRQLRSASTNVVTSVIQTLRHLCIGIGYVTNTANQTTIAQSRGLKFLVALMAHSKAEMIQVEAALTLAAIALGHSENIASLEENPDFTFLHIIRLLYSNNDKVGILAGTALATFSFNNVLQQKAIAECGGVRWHNFAPHLTSKDDIAAINAAFQAVVLSRIIPDEEPAVSSAEGIKELVNRLEHTKKDHSKALAADCIARLSHTRAGVPSAMVSINVIPHLCKLLEPQNDQVRGAVAVALGYLSFDHKGEREILRMCRENPHFIHVLKYYTKNYKLSPAFLEAWQHCVHVGLPCTMSKENQNDFIQTLSQSFTGAFMKPPKDLSPSILTLTEDAGGSRSHSHHQSSRASQLLATIHDDMSQLHGRSTHSSRFTRHSHLTASVQQHHPGSKKSFSPLSQDVGPSISQQSQLPRITSGQS
uniref:ankyrin and armadillo repeat-containing protein-like n=1 Tax=Ciona intestinalis TaxID=7719 RepID=UPI000180D35C|nr:ankyrin and armadillo repeat-containing protein-like [Ciona intestinalis]XP_026690678.1 ankyrin and armadillo repeat-containing protein-like [Ciona intestinalis]|eukprot:XP_009858879.1 ankyrin and armadillo repeat-containing protein-like [Ciona intestinalis]